MSVKKQKFIGQIFPPYGYEGFVYLLINIMPVLAPFVKGLFHIFWVLKYYKGIDKIMPVLYY